MQQKFKKILLCAYIMTAVFSIHAEADSIVTSQQLNITGSVSGGSCTMTLNNSTVDFGDVDMAKLSAGHNESWASITAKADTPPKVILTGCSSAQNYTITLTGTADNTDTDAIANESGANYATGVALEAYLTSADGSTVKEHILTPNTPSDTLTVDGGTLSNGDGDVLNMGLVMTGAYANASPGKIAITGTIDVNYL